MSNIIFVECIKEVKMEGLCGLALINSFSFSTIYKFSSRKDSVLFNPIDSPKDNHQEQIVKMFLTIERIDDASNFIDLSELMRGDAPDERDAVA